MSDLKKLGSAPESLDHIEEAEFVEVGDEPPAHQPKFEQPPGMPSKSDKRLVAGFAVVLFLFLFIAISAGGSQSASAPSAETATPDSEASPDTAVSSERPDPLPTAAEQQALDLAQFIDPKLKPYGQFQIDSDAEASAGPGHRCNRGAMYQYFFNQQAPGTYISWFNDPQTPDMAIGEMGTYGFENGRIHLRAIRGTVYLKKSDGSLRTIEVPDDKLPPEKNAEVTRGSNSIFRIGGVPFRRCDGYF